MGWLNVSNYINKKKWKKENGKKRKGKERKGEEKKGKMRRGKRDPVTLPLPRST